MPRTKRHRLAAAVAALACGVALTASPAQAEVLDQFNWSFEDNGSFDDCGFTIDSQFSASGTTVIRALQDTDQLWFATISRRSEEIFTNPETGDWFRIVGREVIKESGPATEVADGVFTHSSTTAGNPVTVIDSDGTVVARDTGLLRWEITFDTLNDGQPGGELLGEVLVQVAGPHPLLYADYCALATELIG